MVRSWKGFGFRENISVGSRFANGEGEVSDRYLFEYLKLAASESKNSFIFCNFFKILDFYDLTSARDPGQPTSIFRHI